MSALAQHILATPMADTHEHLHPESKWVEEGPDVLADLFAMYIGNDLLSAGAPFPNVERLLNSDDPDIAGRWQGVQEAWELCRHTGYGRAVQLMARLVYEIEELTVSALEAAQEKSLRLRRPGERLRLLRDVANLAYVQTDDFQWACLPDDAGADFFLYDLSWVGFANGNVDTVAILEEGAVDVVDLRSLRRGMESVFARYGECAIAVKSQHAYERTLVWRERSDEETAPVLQRLLSGETLSSPEKLCLGDWALARGAELSAEYHLPFKIHTGFLAGNDFYRRPEGTHPAGLARLVARYPGTRFVFMHMAYPFSDVLVAMAKHFPNVYADMCWGWSLNPYHAADFVRRFLHAVPANKLFAFGGDTCWPTSVVAYAYQARQWLTYALQGEIDDGYLSEREAMALASRLMHENQAACFDLTGTRSAIHADLMRAQ